MGAVNFKKLKDNTLIKCEWEDVIGLVNGSAKDAKPAKCTTIGHIHQQFPNYIVLATSYFANSRGCCPGRASDPGDLGDWEGDFTALPKGMITKIEVI